MGKRPEGTHHQGRYTIVNKACQRVLNILSLRNWKLKQCDTTTHLITMATIQNTDNTKSWWRYSTTRTVIIAGEWCPLEDSSVFLKKLHIVLTYNPAITLLGVYPNKYVHIKTLIRMFTYVIYVCSQTRRNQHVLQ